MSILHEGVREVGRPLLLLENHNLHHPSVFDLSRREKEKKPEENGLITCIEPMAFLIEAMTLGESVAR